MSFREPKVQKSRRSATVLGILVTLKEGNQGKRELWPLFYAISPRTSTQVW
jgi:hypothetical protein